MGSGCSTGQHAATKDDGETPQPSVVEASSTTATNTSSIVQHSSNNSVHRTDNHNNHTTTQSDTDSLTEVVRVGPTAHPATTPSSNTRKGIKVFHSVVSRDTTEPTATLSSSQLEEIEVPSNTNNTPTRTDDDIGGLAKEGLHGPGFSPPVPQHHHSTAWGLQPGSTNTSSEGPMNVPPALLLHSSPTKAPILPERVASPNNNSNRRRSSNNATVGAQHLQTSAAQFRARSFSGQSALVPVLPTYPTSEFGERELSVGESQSTMMTGGTAGGGLESGNTQQRLLNASDQLSPSQQLGESCGALPFAMSGQFGDSLGLRTTGSDSPGAGGGTASPVVRASVVGISSHSSPTTRSSGSPASPTCDELPVKNDPLHPQSSNGDFSAFRRNDAANNQRATTTTTSHQGGGSGTEEVDYNWLDLKQIAEQQEKQRSSGGVSATAAAVGRDARRGSVGVVGLSQAASGGGGSGTFVQQNTSMESNGSSTVFGQTNGSPMLHQFGSTNQSQQRKGSATSGSLSQVFTPPASIAGGSSMGGSPNHHGPLQFGNGADGGSMSGSVRLQPPRQNGMPQSPKHGGQHSFSSSQYGGASPPTQQQQQQHQGLPRQLSAQYQQQSNAPWNYSISTDLQPADSNNSSSVPGLPLIVPVGTSPTSSTIGASFTDHTQQPYYDNSGTALPRQKVQHLADISMLPPHSSDTTSSGTKSSSGGSGSGGKPSGRQQRVVTRCPPLVVPDKSLPIYLSEPGSGSSSFQFQNHHNGSTVPLEDSLQSM